MDQLNIDELNITNVSYRDLKYNGLGYVLTFKIEGFRYILHTEKQEDGSVYPSHINHVDASYHCKYCEGSVSCLELMKHQKELFHRLIEFPSIRLDWLYIHHV